MSLNVKNVFEIPVTSIQNVILNTYKFSYNKKFTSKLFGIL